MKKLICSLTLALITAWPLASSGQPITGSPQVSPGQPSWEKDPAYLPIDKVLDLNTIRPKVNVNLPRFLLQDAASGLTNGPDSPLAGTGIDFAELIKDVKLIRVVVIEADQTNRPALDKAVRTLRADLEAKWIPIVSVPENNVGVYALGDPSGESMAGLAVLVYDGGNVVIANIVGRISIGKLIAMASHMHGLPPGLLQQLQGLGGQATSRGSQAEAKAPAGPAQKPVQTPEGASEKGAPK